MRDLLEVKRGLVSSGAKVLVLKDDKVIFNSKTKNNRLLLLSKEIYTILVGDDFFVNTREPKHILSQIIRNCDKVCF